MSGGEDRLMLRRAALLQLEAAFPAGLSPSVVLEGLRLTGFECDLRELGRELEYLRQKGLVELRPSRISPSSVRASLTCEGADYLESGEF